MAMDPQQLGDILARVRLPARQQIEHLQARFLAPVMFMLYPLLESLRILSNNR
jgi:hypothetical protein